MADVLRRVYHAAELTGRAQPPIPIVSAITDAAIVLRMVASHD